MMSFRYSLTAFLLMVMLSSFLLGQQQPAQSSDVVPRLVNYSGKATDLQGKPIAGITGVTFAIYKDEQGGAPLWMETQNVTADAKGNYTVQLGATKPDGLALELFRSGEARWLGVSINGEEERPRVLLLSVPYALKAADAQTLGGLAASAFLLRPPPSGGSSEGSASPSSSSDNSAAPGLSGGGKPNYIPVWTSTSKLGNSVLFQSGKGAKALVGINTKTPATTLDVNGNGTLRGVFSLPATGTATSGGGYNSQPMEQTASAYNSGTGTPVAQNFQWQAEPVNNDTNKASGTLNLLFATGNNQLAETGLNIASNGQITFAGGQTFPGAGTVTSVGSGSGLTGGPITSSGTLSVATGGITNTMLANPSLTVTAGTDLMGGGVVSLGGSTTLNVDTTKVVTGVVAGTDLTGGGNGGVQTLNLDTTKVPQLNAANTFTGTQTVNGNLTATGVVTGSSYQIGSNLFASGSYNNASAFLGFAGNTTSTGFGNLASGASALSFNTTGYDNTASGYLALNANTTGAENTASGRAALNSNTTGSLNTASGAVALSFNNTGDDNTASGAFALAYNTTGNYNTASGNEALYDNTTADYNTASGYEALVVNTTGGDNLADGAEALRANTTGGGNTGVGAGALYTNVTGNYLTCVGYYCTTGEDGLSNATAIGSHAVVSQSNSLVLGGTGEYAVKVGIGTTTPSNILTIARGGGHPVSDSWETYSSRRWKTNIKTLPNALAKVEHLRGVSYDLKDSGKHEIGVIAEEVGAVVPEIVTYEDNRKDARGVDYSRLTALLIEAVKQQEKQIVIQSEQIRKLRSKDITLESKLTLLQSKIEELRQVRKTGSQLATRAVLVAQPQF